MLDINIAQLAAAATHVWYTTTGLPLRYSARFCWRPREVPVAVAIRFRGEVAGELTLSCHRKLAIRAAASMFSELPEQMTPCHLEDALLELANMTAGCIKTLIPGHTDISIPSPCGLTAEDLAELRAESYLRCQLDADGDALTLIWTEGP